MFPAFYQTTLRAHLSETQYLTLQLLFCLLQVHRQVKLSTLASVFPQPIHYQSRKRHLQRFLALPPLTVKVLWFPLLKYWLRQVQTGRGGNREQRRRLRKLKHHKWGYWLVAIDRTQWRDRNVFMVSLVWGNHALPLYWETLNQLGNSDLRTQKRLLKAVLPLFQKYPVLVLGDREFHSPKLAEWLDSRGIAFALRQKKDLHFKITVDAAYQIVKALDIQPGMARLYPHVFCNRGDGLGPFNLAVYWKRTYRGQGPKAPWYILTNLTDVKLATAIYRCRWGIEQLFKDCKTGGYHLEGTKVNERRLLALILVIAMAYTFATLYGQRLRQLRIDHYAGRLQEHSDETLRHSHFSLGLYGQRWLHGMEIWADWAAQLMALKPHKQLYFQRGLHALSLMQQAL